MAFAFLAGAPSRAEKPFVDAKTMTKKMRDKLKPALDASFNFRLDGGVDCTGTYISSSGHFLTALHCVTSCLARGGALRRTLAHEEPVKELRRPASEDGEEAKSVGIYAYRVTVSDDRVDDGITCKGRVGDRKTDLRVVLTGGKGWLTPKDTLAEFSRRFPAAYKELLDQGYEHGYDFAILHDDGVSMSLANPTCVQLAETAPATNEALHSISYACLSRDGLSAIGQTPLYTSGKKTEGIRSSELFKRNKGKLPFEPALVERKETFFSTLDMEKCGSGTAILDDRLAVVGVATRVYKSSTEYERGSLEAVDVVQVWRDLREKKSSDAVDIITGCKPKPKSGEYSIR